MKTVKKVIALVLAFVILAAATSCSNNTPVPKENLINDNYRNYYEIFVSSFCDSNGDGIGDLKGLISKLDYLNDGNSNTTNDLGINGIWLMPIMPSPSYHKYDVTDYFNVDSKYGTLSDFETLVKECHKRGIKLIIDLVLNHTSSSHPWFINAKNAAAAGKTSNPYFSYYNFTKESGRNNYYDLGSNGYYYESSFSKYMPDLNMDCPDVRKQVEKIAKFWVDKGVDGFRLDAIRYIYEDKDKSINFLKWFNSYCKSIKSDFYLVGEDWSSGSEITDYYASGIDSLFNFPFADISGTINSSINGKTGSDFAQNLASWQQQVKSANANAIDAPFLSNHDMNRSAGVLGRDPVKEKNAASIYMLMPGNTFIYYGEELGMLGSGKDENKRLPFLWSSTKSTGITKPVSGADNIQVIAQGEEQQQKDDNSLLNFYKKLIKIKNQYPEIARGAVTAMELPDETICAYSTVYKGSKVVIIHNFSDKSKQVAQLSSSCGTANMISSLTPAGEGTEKPAVKNDTLTLPPYATAILK